MTQTTERASPPRKARRVDVPAKDADSVSKVARRSAAAVWPLQAAVGELRRLRSALTELGALVTAHLTADVGEVVALGTARIWAAEAYARGRTDGVEAGRLEIVAELKATDRGLRAALDLEIKRWGPGGRTCFGKPRPGDFPGRKL